MGTSIPEQARQDMATFVDAGITTFDCADIYTGVERLIGSFRRAYPAHAEQVQIHTKFVPDLSDLRSVDRVHVEAIIDRSLRRLGQERLDLVQFHWWDFADPALRRDGPRTRSAAPRRKDRAHRSHEFRHAASERTRRCRRYRSHRTRFNTRWWMIVRITGWSSYCRAQNIALLCYGTVCGGFLSERWLGKPAPAPDLANRSLTKYKLIIEDFGGWDLFQELLEALRRDCRGT